MYNIHADNSGNAQQMEVVRFLTLEKWKGPEGKRVQLLRM